MFREKARMVEFIKPKLKYFTTIDFGRITYENDFYALLGQKRVSIDEDRLIKREWFKGEYRLIISTPENGRSEMRQAFASDLQNVFPRRLKAAGSSRNPYLIE
jgi:hypothetical protein